MVRAFLTLVSVVAVIGAGAPATAGGCKGCELVAKKAEGFCCGKGKIFGVDLTSKKLYDALAGKTVDADKIKCSGCKTAAKSNGICSHCNVGVANGKVYHSLVAHSLAKGLPVTPDKVGYCSGCTTAHNENGFCKACSVGFIAGRMLANKKVYEIARTAYQTLVAAVETAKKCVGCAVAMVTDGECSQCKLNYKDGKKKTG